GLLSGADERELRGVAPCQPARGHPRDRAGAELPEDERLDHRLETPRAAVPEDEERGRAAGGVGPGLGADESRARRLAAERVQAVSLAPYDVGLLHGLCARRGLEREPALDGRDRLGKA